MEQTQETPAPQATTNETELKACKDNLLYLTAEFNNYKKRVEKERAQWIQGAQSSVLLNILPIVDDFERAMAQIQSQKLAPELASHLTGFELILKSLHKLLDSYDVREITQLKTFNPELHEAIVQVESPGHHTGDIVAVLQKGYTFKGQVLRPAQVSVAK